MNIVCYEWCIKNITIISCQENQVWKLKKAEKGQVQLARLFQQYQHEFESCQHHKKSLGFEIEVRYRQERLFEIEAKSDSFWSVVRKLPLSLSYQSHAFTEQGTP